MGKRFLLSCYLLCLSISLHVRVEAEASGLPQYARMGGSVNDFLTKLRDDGELSPVQYNVITSNFHDLLATTRSSRAFSTASGKFVGKFLKDELRHGRLSVATVHYLSNLLRLNPVSLDKPQRNNVQSSYDKNATDSSKGEGGRRGSGGGEVTFLGRFDPSPPASSSKSYNGIWGYNTGSREYALQCHSNGLHIVDITSPSTPTRIQYIPMKGGDIWRDVETHQDPVTGKTYAYVAAQSLSFEEAGTLYVVDLSGLSPDHQNEEDSNPCHFHEISDGTTDNLGHTLTVGGGLLFLNSANGGGCHTYDLLQDPWEPRFLGASHDGFSYDCHDSHFRENAVVPNLQGTRNLLYSADGQSGQWTIVDVTNIRNGQTTVLGQTEDVTYSTYAHSSALTDDGRYLYVFEESNSFDMGVFDVSDPRNPVLLDTFQYSDDSSNDMMVHNGYVRGDRLYVAYYEAGFRVYDITNPAHPIETGYYETAESESSSDCFFFCFGGGDRGAWNVYVGLDSGRILVSDRDYGTYIFEINEGQGSSNPGPSPSPPVGPPPAASPVSSPDTCNDAPGGDCSLIELFEDCEYAEFLDPQALFDCCFCGGGDNNNGDNTSPEDSNGEFDINLRILLDTDSRVEIACRTAKQYWESVIVGDVWDYVASEHPIMDLSDGLLTEPVNVDVDDVIVWCGTLDLAELGGKLGVGGPIINRLDNFGRRTSPVSGIILLDENAVDSYTQSELGVLAKHEMSHVLGFGEYFEDRCATGCNDNDSCAYTCTNAIQQHDNLGLPGTLRLDSEDHWDDDAFCDHDRDGKFSSSCTWEDIMVGYLDTSIDYIVTRVTVGALQDLGYQVNYERADPIPTRRRARMLRKSTGSGVGYKGSLSLKDRFVTPSQMSSEIRSMLNITAALP